MIRRHLGLPWNICRTDRLLIRELTADDACHIPEEEYGPEEAIFRLRDTLELYCRNQYGFYEYGTWALVRRDDQVLVGLAGVSNPRLKREMEECLDSMGQSVPWLGVRLCALIRRENQASRKVAEGLGMTCLMETDTQSSEGQLLYGESLV